MTKSELGPVQRQSPCTPRMINPKGSGMKEHLKGGAGGWVLGAPVAETVWRPQGEGPAAPCTWGPRDLWEGGATSRRTGGQVPGYTSCPGGQTGLDDVQTPGLG